jgi:hypothetical protein
MGIATQQNFGFDLFRLSKAKSAVDVSPNTIRAYFKEGLNSYRQGKAVFISRMELDAFIRRKPVARKSTRR